MPSLDLTGKQFQSLSIALRKAFTLAKLTQMLRIRLEQDLENIALGDDYEEIVFKLIRAAEAQGWTTELLLAARAENPKSDKLLEIAQLVGLGASTPALERKIQQTTPFFDVVTFRTRLAEIENRICRMEIPSRQGTIFGTGFLLGPSIVMTNYHVLETVIRGEVEPSAPVFRFDYKRLANSVVNAGFTFKLASEDWLVDYSPPSEVDFMAEPKPGAPRLDELDYAIVRLEGTPGTDPIGASTDPGSPPRGWLEVPEKPEPLLNNSPMLIVQHPEGAPLKLALEMDGVIGLNANSTRVKYSVNTEAGSSGSPCFNADWDLIALHHSGDPNFDPVHKPEYNEGIPLGVIVRLLQERGKKQVALGPWS